MPMPRRGRRYDLAWAGALVPVAVMFGLGLTAHNLSAASATNVAEMVICPLKGKDVRHTIGGNKEEG